MYKALFGMDGKPIEIFDTGTTNMLLLAAIAIGVLPVSYTHLDVYKRQSAFSPKSAPFAQNTMPISSM